MAKTTVEVLVLPGLGGSGPSHWQSLWEARFGYRRLEQQDWDRPEKGAWVLALERVVLEGSRPLVLVAHSLACAVVTHFAAAHPRSRVAAAFLVAPADVDSEWNTPRETRCFAPMPMRKLPFPSLLVASSTDPYIAVTRARSFAEAWGAQWADIGAEGHINAEAGLGEWPEGHAMLERLIQRSVAGQRDDVR